MECVTDIKLLWRNTKNARKLIISSGPTVLFTDKNTMFKIHEPSNSIRTEEIEHLMEHSTKMEISVKDFFSKCDQISSFLWIWLHLLKKSLTENLIFFAV